MRDLVETVIAQVIKEPYTSSSSSNRRVSTGRTPAFVKSYANSTSFDRSEIKDEKLWDVCCKFEAIFMQQMMSAMRKTVPKSGFLPSGYAEGVHDSMMDQAIADSGSKHGSLGIARQMYRQLEASEAGHDDAIQGIQETTDNVDMVIYNDIKGETNGSY
ncbi:MAG: rod-binding protein [Mariprofundaceae bacterium]